MKSIRQLITGSAWYPEQWDRDVWAEDIANMRKLGLNVARLGEFAWAKLEPREGEYDFDWLQDALDLLHANELQAILCTPTATPPAWLLQRHPEIGYVEADGYRYGHGARQHASYNSAIFRRYAGKITKKLAERFGHHPALLAWQIDNELGSHQQRCFSNESVSRWHHWLEKRYGNIDRLNEAWKTEVWSQVYPSFDAVPPPKRLPYYSSNFSLKVNYRRFMTEMIADFQAELIALVRQHSDRDITHNSTSHQCELRLSQHLDFPSIDIYARYTTLVGMLYQFDVMRNLSPTRQFITMETGPEDQINGELFRPGWLGCFAFLNYCMGGTGLSFWPWRQQPGGAEILHPAILHASGQPSSGWTNVREAVETRKRLEGTLNSYQPAKAKVALVTSDYHGKFYYEDGSGGLEENFNFRQRREECYQPLVDLNVWRDVIYDEADFNAYEVFFSPYLPCLRPELIEQLLGMVQAGSTWVIGPYSGYLTSESTAPQNAILGDLEQRLGFKTKHMISHAGSLPVELLGHRGTSSQFATVFVESEKDEVIGRYADERFQGEPWGLKRQVGQGTVILLGSHLDAPSYRVLWRWILNRAEQPDNPGLIEIPLTSHEGKPPLRAIANLANEERSVPLKASESLVTGSSPAVQCSPNLTLPARTWGVLRA